MIKCELLIPGKIKGTRVRIPVYMKPRDYKHIGVSEDVALDLQKVKLPWWRRAINRLRRR